MKPRLLFWAALAACALAPAAARPDPRAPGRVTLPLAQWAALAQRANPTTPRAAPPPVEIVHGERSISGVFRKGLLRATLVARFSVISRKGHVRVPVIDGAAVPQQALLNGKTATLVKQRGIYTVGVDQPGDYTVQIRLLVGQEQDRFARRLRLWLPSGGSTRLSVLVPERPIEARLGRGALTEQLPRGTGTLLRGYLDASGLLDLSWSRRLTHSGTASFRMEARVNTLYTVHEALVRGESVFELKVLDGQTDRIDLRLPASVEVLGVSGNAVLQWQTQPGSPGRLIVLLRHLVRGRQLVRVQFQLPVHKVSAINLPLILPPPEVPLSGTMGVQAPSGLNVRVVRQELVTPLTLRDLPAQLTALTRSPLLLGFAFTRPPGVTLALTRNKQVTLTSTLIDDLQAATVITAQGVQQTKLKLHMRNNTRQYLTVRLPPGSRLTGALLDGHPVQPARGPGRDLLFPLRQSRRIDPDKGRTHRVRPGETLGDISHFYYSDPSKWPLILNRNRELLGNENGLQAGQQLRIPSAGPVRVEESSFVLELSYRRAGAAPGMAGRLAVRLPRLDVDAMKVAWHLYLPTGISPIHFAGNLTQYTAIRYGPFRRAVDFARQVLSGHRAWAGDLSGAQYKSILSRRRNIYRDQEQRRGLGQVAPGGFPLVGQRFRFKRVLARAEQPRVTVAYTTSSLAAAARWGALLLALGLTTLLLRAERRRWWLWLVCGVSAAGLLVAAHFFLGVHRRLVWGVALALALGGLRLLRDGQAAERLRRLAWSPWRVGRMVTGRSLATLSGLTLLTYILLSYPMALSLVAAAALLWWTRRATRAPDEPEPEPEQAAVTTAGDPTTEVTHAE